MAIQEVNIGTIANDGTGDDPRTGMGKVNSNFTDPNNAASKLVGTAAGQIPTIDDLGTAALADTGTGAGNVPLNSDLGTASTKNVQSSPTDATAGAVLNNETTHVGGNINYTGANFQPDTSLGIGVIRVLKNVSGATLSDGSTASGTDLRKTWHTASSVFQSTGGSISGIWRVVSGVDIPNNYSAEFVKVSN